MKSRYRNHIVFLLLLVLGCKNTVILEEHEIDVKNWRTERLSDLKSADGWTTLAGLYWLNHGENLCGSSNSMDLVFPRSTPTSMGTFLLDSAKVSFISHPEVKISDSHGNPVNEISLYPYDSIPISISWNAHQWYVIKRGDKFGIRLRDTLHPNRQMLESIPAYPINIDWKIEANVSYQDTNRTINIENVLGQMNVTKIVATLTFQIENQVYELQAINGGENEFFVIFSDETTGNETYGGGRYIYPKKPVEGNTTFLDFNLAYNPPCVFTDFATCPLPPSENHLTIKITAGEQYSEGIAKH